VRAGLRLGIERARGLVHPGSVRGGALGRLVLAGLVGCAPPATSPGAADEDTSAGSSSGHVEPSAASTTTDGGGESDALPTPPGTSTTSEPEPPEPEPPAPGSTGAEDDPSTGEPVDPGPPFEVAALEPDHVVVLGVKGPGQAWADVDGDGWLELLTVGGMVPSQLWRNLGNGSFELSPLLGPHAAVLDTIGATFADYDNDGDPDLYILRYGPNLLLRNDGPLGFTDVSEAAGVAYDGRPASAAWGDYDGDSWLDLYVADGGGEADVFYHNEGNGTFTEVTHLLPAAGEYATYGVTFADFDGDGDPDLYVANDKKVGNDMWRNDGPGCGGWCFTDVGAAWSAESKVDSMGVAVGDIDNDLDLDLSVTDNHRHNILVNMLAETGEPSFVDVSAEVGVIFDAYGWGTVFFDYDNDGWLDLYVADANLGPGQSSRLFHNELGSFVDVTPGCGCAEPGWSHGVSHADYDHDGALDLVVGQRGQRHVLYRNRNTTGNHWLEVELRGGGPVNRDAVGARVWVTTTGARVLMREVELGSSVASQNSLRLHFGLGRDEVAAIEIRWPDGTLEQPLPPATDTLWVHEYPG
jgi:enediyne biosynthesis protein E4